MRFNKQLLKKLLLNIKYWVLPPGIFRFLRYYKLSAVSFYFFRMPIIRMNNRLLDKHKGKRCFIVCNGPSLKTQNIRILKKELVFTVSNGFLHPDFEYINPKYHCIPQISYDVMPKLEAAKWLNSIDRHIGNAEIFLDHQEFSLIKKNKLFLKRQVHFMCLGKNNFSSSKKIPDIDGLIPRVQTVPIMALMIAMYMGFKEIYLLGVDHDWFVKKEYSYFYGKGVTRLDPKSLKDGENLSLLLDELPIVTKVFYQYRCINKIAKANGVKIFNATNGGMLDEFERTDFKELFK